MKNEMDYLPDKNIILAKISGEAFLSSVQEAAQAGLDLSRKTECHCYLIDLTETVIRYSLGDSIAFLEGLWKMGFSPLDRVAFVVKKGKHDYSFWETAALNRGWGRLGYFESQADAEKWLLAEEAKQKKIKIGNGA